MHLQVVLARQVRTGQCRSESFPYCAGVLLPQQPHYPRSKLLWLGSIRLPPSTTVLQSPSPPPFRIAARSASPAGNSGSGSLPHPPTSVLHSLLGPALPLAAALVCSSMSFPAKTSSGGSSLGDISNEGIRGDYESGATEGSDCSADPKDAASKGGMAGQKAGSTGTLRI